MEEPKVKRAKLIYVVVAVVIAVAVVGAAVGYMYLSYGWLGKKYSMKTNAAPSDGGIDISVSFHKWWGDGGNGVSGNLSVLVTDVAGNILWMVEDVYIANNESWGMRVNWTDLDPDLRSADRGVVRCYFLSDDDILVSASAGFKRP